ncbi:hypothetical protein N7468_000534 [Penicillium chermesinum]|uniref:Uncharacterized protein n=1 Tax=Penicillium chermesinum TaxID=63820 RepID=A0A9W9PM77_9EURO|nr:uncharacterized protein N7468_000534 [Penicillium chermesinum]KAJ5249083.1 hypothetical protein N7468_000534 [Penicillium chermesinum]KAJ6151187.1 hypothetical protein N7470_007781 [Penicillium chermesinum]
MPGSSTTRCDRDALLLLMMFHCLLEIASGSTQEWTYHMKGAIQVMKYYRNLYPGPRDVAFSPEVVKFVHIFFIEKDTFLRTTTMPFNDTEKDDFDSLRWSTEISSLFPFLNSGNPTRADPCMGLSPELLDIISSINERARDQLTSGRPEINYTLLDTLKSRLHKLELIRETSDQAQLVYLNSIAFQEATWIYLHHIVGNQPRESEVIQRFHLPKLLEIIESIHQAQGIHLCYMPYPMWALFIASCVVPEERRVRILELFALLKQKKPMSNVPSTLCAVEAIWKRRDLEAEGTHRYSTAHQNLWVDVISQLGWKMSLT